MLNSDDRAKELLGSLVALTVATLVLVAIDKPFRGKDERSETAQPAASTEAEEKPKGVSKVISKAKEIWKMLRSPATLGDKLMLVSLASQLANYGVAYVCLEHKEDRYYQGLDGMSDEVTLFAAVVGFLLVGVQVAGVVYTYLDEKADKKKKANTTDEGKPPKANPKTTMMKFNNPLNQNTDDRVDDGMVTDDAPTGDSEDSPGEMVDEQADGNDAGD